MLKVGRDTIIDKKTNKTRWLNYNDVPHLDQWVDASKYLPGDYDLVIMKTETKTFPGWFSGIAWDGYRVPPNSNVLYWKREDQ